jgi:hypothetical protein
MNNQVFTQKNTEEKRDYLTAFLRSSSGGALDESMIDRVLPNISINRQYTVTVHDDLGLFRSELLRMYTGTGTLYLALSEAGSNQVVAVITAHEPGYPEKLISAIYVYSPDQAIWKGAQKCAKVSGNA